MDENDRQIMLEPEKDVVFVCGKSSISAILKIQVVLEMPRSYAYSFQIKSTNKQDYKVSEPTGMIKKSPHIIYFYFRGASITKGLKDKFLITIKNMATGKEVLSQKLGIMIESALTSTNPDTTAMDHLGNSNTTKFTSIYQSSINSNIMGSMMESGNRQNRLRQLPNVHFYRGDKRSKEQEESLKTDINDSIREIEKKQRKVLVLEREYRNKKAHSRLSYYFAIFIIVICFFLGWYFKTIDLKGFAMKQMDSIKTIFK